MNFRKYDGDGKENEGQAQDNQPDMSDWDNPSDGEVLTYTELEKGINRQREEKK